MFAPAAASPCRHMWTRARAQSVPRSPSAARRTNACAPRRYRTGSIWRGPRADAAADGFDQRCSMPKRPLRVCVQPGCSALVPKGRCAQHSADTRPSAARRGYDSTWRQLRLAVLAEEPTCQFCGSVERPHIDHIDGDPWNRTRANLRRLCHSCHSQHTGKTQTPGQHVPGWKNRGPAPPPPSPLGFA
jgi:5-methylcytosine-specific restriction enzyme A